MKNLYIIQVSCTDGCWYVESLREPTTINEHFKEPYWTLCDSKRGALKWESRHKAFEALCAYSICCGGLIKIVRYFE